MRGVFLYHFYRPSMCDEGNDYFMFSYIQSGCRKGGVGLGATAVFYGSTLRSIGMLSVHALRNSSPLMQARLDIAHKFLSEFIH